MREEGQSGVGSLRSPGYCSFNMKFGGYQMIIVAVFPSGDKKVDSCATSSHMFTQIKFLLSMAW